MASRVLVIGGQRSGKSRHGETLAVEAGGGLLYIATATAGDAEMVERIAAHRRRRGPAWQTIEEPLDLAGAIMANAGAGRTVMVDCLTLWLSNVMGADRDPDVETSQLVDTVAHAPGTLILISNEVGSGIIPMNALARRFADAQGILNQRVAAAVDSVVLMAAGLPLRLKPQPEPTA